MERDTTAELVILSFLEPEKPSTGGGGTISEVDGSESRREVGLTAVMWFACFVVLHVLWWVVVLLSHVRERSIAVVVCLVNQLFFRACVRGEWYKGGKWRFSFWRLQFFRSYTISEFWRGVRAVVRWGQPRPCRCLLSTRRTIEVYGIPFFG